MSNDTDIASCRRICLTPTRNESWIIAPFLAAAKFWATDIIVADQGSTDGTLEQLQRTEGVRTIINDSPVYDEVHRQKLLIGEARRIEQKRVLIALDADEALSANFKQSPEWEKICNASPGTVLRFKWVNILPNFKTAWIPEAPMPCGFIDDGSEHVGERIHSRRVPFPRNAPVLDLHDIVVLHFQYVAPDRVSSKHRWYQAWEYHNRPKPSALDIFRQYNHRHGSWNSSELHPVRDEWLAGYRRAGIDFETLAAEPITWWDREVVRMLRERGPAHFRRLDIWDRDWNSVAAEVAAADADLADPRGIGEKLAHVILKKTQKHRARLAVRGFEHLLRTCGW